MSLVDTGEFDLDLTVLDELEREVETATPAMFVEAIDDDPPELDEGDFVFIGWHGDI